MPDRLKTNAFRVLRLSADASLSEIHKAAGSMRRAVLLGVANATEADMPLLGEISLTEADIRAAIGRLENPTQRLSDRLFWFHLPPESRNTKAPVRPSGPDGAVWDHDEALRGLFAAFETGFNDVGVPAWVRALRAWHQVISDDDYWAYIVELEQRGAFEPAAFPSEIDALRADAVGLAAEPLVVAGRDALVHDDASTVRRILVALEELVDTGLWVAIAQQDIASPVVERFRALCRAVREDFNNKIVREQNAGKRNKKVCDAELERFRADIEPELHKVIQLVPPDHQAAQEAREEAALCLSAIASDYTWADDFIASEQLHEEALKLAHNTLGTIRIEHGLEQIRASARKQRVFGASISSAPTLGTFNGFGCTLYGRSDYDQETQSYTTTHYCVALFVPILPLGRYRVINVGDNTYRFLGKLPLRKADRWHLGIALSAVATMILFGIVSSNQSQSYAPSTNTSSSYKSSSGQSADSSTSETNSGNAAATSGTTSDTPRVFNIPVENASSGEGSSEVSSNDAQLSDLRSRIEAGRTRRTALETQLQPVTDEIDSLTARIKPMEAEIKALDQKHAEGMAIDTDRRDSLFDEYDRLFKRRRALFDANSNDFKAMDDLEKADKDMMEQWKALGGKVN